MHKRLFFAALAAAAAFYCLPAHATISGTCPPTTYTGNGSTVAFTIPCRFLVSTDVVVTVAGVVKTLNTDYTVTGAGGTTGTVTFNSAPASSAAVVLSRFVQPGQPLSLRTNRTFDPSSLENALDREEMRVQQILPNGFLPVANGGLGGVLTCNGSQVVTCNGSTCSCTANISPSQPVTYTSASMTAVPGTIVAVTSLASNLLITLPSAALTPNGSFVTVKDVTNSAGGGIDGTGHILAINTAAGTVDGVAQEYVYNDSGYCTYESDGVSNWVLTGDGGCGVDPRGISGLQAWYDFGRGVTVSAISGTSVNQNLTQILDQSGNNHTLTPTNAAAGQYLNAGVHGRARFIFDSTVSSLQSGTMTPPSGNGTVLAVASLTTIGSSSTYYCLFSQGFSNTLGAGSGFAAFGNTGTTPQNQAVTILSGNVVIGTNMAGELISTGSNVSAFDFYLWGWSYSATASYVHFNGSNNTRSTSPATATATPTAYTMNLGSDRFSSGTVSDNWHGTVSELVWFTPDLTEAQLKPLEKTFLRKFDLRH